MGFEIALTRYFAVAKWSEYGYWVISIVLAGFALSGVVMALGRDALLRRADTILAALPALLVAAAAFGFLATAANPFNPLQLQNPATVWPQLGLIGLYYAALLPFFFLAGLFVSLCFVRDSGRIGRLYGFDLTGAGAGALLALVLMWVVPPLHPPALLLPPLALAALGAPRRRAAAVAASLLALVAAEALLLLANPAAVNDYKAIFAPLHVPGSRTVVQTLTPRGVYDLLDDFTERVDTDVSNDAAMLGLPGPPATFGLYRDGNRLVGLPRPGPIDAGYAGSTLAALPYVLRPHGRALLIGASGGLRPIEAHALGAAAVTVLEPEPVLRRAVLRGLAEAPRLPAAPWLQVLPDSPLAFAATQRGWDIIDVAGDFLDSAEANATALSAEALATDLRALSPTGVLSVPVSIREFPAYALRLLSTARAALTLAHVPGRPADHVLVWRSAWNVRVMLSRAPFAPADVAAARQWCADRSFDVPFLPGPAGPGAPGEIYNDLPAVSFDSDQVDTSGGPHDAIADEARAVLAGVPVPSGASFDLRPMTLDRPGLYALLRLDRAGTLLRRLELLPQTEIGPLVNLAVLAQAVVIALVVLAVPLAGQVGARRGKLGRTAVYFASLGLGFLFLEIFCIDRASLYLNDRTTGFALVLTTMLIGSGLGSMLSERFARAPVRAAGVAAGLAVAWCVAMRLGLQPAILATLDWPYAVRLAIVVGAVGPLSIALGLPFPLGLAQLAGSRALPWAWGLNGAFSVVATPLAQLVDTQVGTLAVLSAAQILYLLAALTFPRPARVEEGAVRWQDIPA